MSDERSLRVRQLFDIAITIAPEYRHDWLIASCPDDLSIVPEVEAWLAAQEQQPVYAQAPAAAPPAQEEQGEMLGAYRLVRELGRGGMGSVFLAIRSDDVFRKIVAIKVIRGDRADAEFIRRFREERQLLASLDHPNIARILDGGSTHEGLPYYVMDYVDGQPLDDYCANHRPSVAQKIGLFRQICAAVQYLHDNRVIHRDLKPSNIMVAKDGTVKLLDFGIAKVQAPGQANLTVMTGEGGGRIMTPAYASPEQIHGQPIEAPSDVYALGVILYEMLTGNRPYADAGDGTAKMAALAAGIPPQRPSTNVSEARAVEPVFDLRKRLEGDLDFIILHALAIQTMYRYQSAAALSEDLRCYLENRPLAGRPAGTGERFTKFVKRKPMALVAAIVIVALAGFGAWQVAEVFRQKARVQEKEAEIAQILDRLGKRLDTPGTTDEEFTHDVQRVEEIFRRDLPNLLQMTPDTPRRSEELATQGVSYLERARQRAQANANVSPHIADAFQAAGDLQSGASKPAGEKGAQRGFGNTEAAKKSYQSSGEVWQRLVVLNPNDARVRQRLSQVESRLVQLGGSLRPPQQNTPPPEEIKPPAPDSPVEVFKPRKPEGKTDRPIDIVTPPPAPPPTPPPAPPPTPTIDPALVREVRERYSTVSADVQTAEGVIASVKKSVEAQGRGLDPDTVSAEARMRSNLETAKEQIAQNDFAGAKESLARAEVEALKLKRKFGR